MTSIAFFNNKGGVGKTTLLTNLAGFLAKRGRRVLVIDADPQCNATQSMFNDKELERIYDKGEFTLLDVVEPLSKGRGFSEAVKTLVSERYKCNVLPGHPGMSLKEDLLASDWVSAKTSDVRGMRTTLLFRKLIEMCNDYHYILIDMGPSLGAINRAVLLGAHYYIVPMSIDIFSLKAIENIGVQLLGWKKQWDRSVGDLPSLGELEVADSRWRLRYAGYVTQQYKAKKSHGEVRAVDAYDRILKKVPQAIHKNLVIRFGGTGGAKAPLGSIPLLHSLVPISQAARAPIFSLKTNDGARGAHLGRARDFESTIARIADAVEKATEAGT